MSSRAKAYTAKIVVSRVGLKCHWAWYSRYKGVGAPDAARKAISVAEWIARDRREAGMAGVLMGIASKS
ncbi:hypothetical protein GCM10009552_42660 [Rothia nasimurium]